MNFCESCGSKENLIESGGQFCGGEWWVCKSCDDESKRISEFIKSGRFKEFVFKDVEMIEDKSKLFL